MDETTPTLKVSSRFRAGGGRWKPALRSVDGSRLEKRRSRRTTLARTCTAQPAGYSDGLGTTTTRWPRFAVIFFGDDLCPLRLPLLLFVMIARKRRKRAYRQTATRRRIESSVAHCPPRLVSVMRRGYFRRGFICVFFFMAEHVGKPSLSVTYSQV